MLLILSLTAESGHGCTPSTHIHRQIDPIEPLLYCHQHVNIEVLLKERPFGKSTVLPCFMWHLTSRFVMCTVDPFFSVPFLCDASCPFYPANLANPHVYAPLASQNPLLHFVLLYSPSHGPHEARLRPERRNQAVN